MKLKRDYVLTIWNYLVCSNKNVFNYPDYVSYVTIL